MYLDREMWEKIVLNLLSNAFKFTLSGEIAVRLVQEDGNAVLEVADSGAGIPQHELPRLFERFHRIEGTPGRTQEGSGIGLAWPSATARRWRGCTAARSRSRAGSGHGTTLRVRIPFGSAHLPAERIRAPRESAAMTTSAQAYVQEALRWLPEPASNTLPLLPGTRRRGC